jgi:hypothetical protein
LPGRQRGLPAPQSWTQEQVWPQFFSGDGTLERLLDLDRPLGCHGLAFVQPATDEGLAAPEHLGEIGLSASGEVYGPLNCG